MIRTNSAASYREGRKQLLPRRADQVIAVYRRLQRPLRDREVMEWLRYRDMNTVRPVITDLIGKKILREVGDETDPKTHRKCRLVALMNYDDKQAKLVFSKKKRRPNAD